MTIMRRRSTSFAMGLTLAVVALFTGAGARAGDAPSGLAEGSRPQESPKPSGVVAVLGDGTRHWDVVRALAFSPDGRALVSASDDGTITLRDPRSVQALRTIGVRQVDDDPVAAARSVAGAFFALAFSPDSRTLIAASSNKNILAWDVA